MGDDKHFANTRLHNSPPSLMLAPMFRHVFTPLIALCLLALTACTAPRAAITHGDQPVSVAPPPTCHAGAWILVDANSGVPLLASNADDRRAVASTQKLLTALVVLDQGNLEKTVTIRSTDVQVEPTKLSTYGMRVGDTYTRRELLYVVLVKSCNDVAKALARDVAGSSDAFASMMNAKARQLGMKDSYFVNPHGLSEGGQHSTARDMARCALVAYRSDLVRDAVRRRTHKFRLDSGRVVTFVNTNELLDEMPECNGMKTGYTNAAGPCLISSASSGRNAVILVQLNNKGRPRWNDGAALMRWGLHRLAGG
jgi:serine-type D-Ala-D-Ala carboxypeptidase (penicillin-binding protein 5/6)